MTPTETRDRSAAPATRESWHRVAEHVLAAGQYAAAGTIRLRALPGGFGTTAGVDGRQLAVVGDRLVVTGPDGRSGTPLTTLREVAAAAGVRPGLTGSYTPATSSDPDAPLPVDLEAAATLAAWYALGDAALRRLAAALGSPQEPVLWPEHLDLGITHDAVNYGVSPGDDAVPEPYAYAGPHEGRPAGPDVDRDFWTAPFGAVRTAAQVPAADDVLDFFLQAKARIDEARTEAARTDRSRS
ncbi:hypothetical protein [Geodermatophilus marinus]|uniref:hypothetical protein n=1 Tax=Geodermatophilus sp. LHW52908 TaxID=2303986 RepID=UPI000E3C3930|nr:hypothetical protein [Geodermatophilus sp. LHW52908]RFU21581.1 hypothetical protein D0Z06_10300 [Geodermatophilus sp. LHW52908]